MRSGRYVSVALFAASKLFTSKLNAIGIANLPSAVMAFRDVKNARSKPINETWKLYLLLVFHCVVVYVGLVGKWPILIKITAVWKIMTGVYDSIEARHEAAIQQARKNNQAVSRGNSIEWTLLEEDFSISSVLKNALFMTTNHGADEPDDEDKPEKPRKRDQAHKAMQKTKKVLKGKRESSTDDLLWGAFQVAFVILDETIPQAIGYAWLMFLLSVMEDVILNREISTNKRMRRLVWLVMVGYFSGKLVLPDSFRKRHEE